MEEVLQGALLLLGEIVQPVQLHEFIHVGKDGLGISQVLVYIVEV